MRQPVKDFKELLQRAGLPTLQGEVMAFNMLLRIPADIEDLCVRSYNSSVEEINQRDSLEQKAKAIAALVPELDSHDVYQLLVNKSTR